MLQVTLPCFCVQVPCDSCTMLKVTPAGSWSVTWTPVAVLGPLFLITRMYQKGLPCWNPPFSSWSSESANFVIWRSAVPAFAATMAVVAEAELLAVFGSVSLPLMVVGWVMVGGRAGVFVTMVIVAVAPEANAATLEVTVAESLEQVPWVALGGA